MSVYRQKKPDGSLKAIVVSVRRQNQEYKKYFKIDEFKEAVKYEKQLLKTLPKKARSGKPKGYKNKALANNRNPNSFTKHNCTVNRGDLGERCSLYDKCIFYDECLYEAAKRNWSGFTNIFERGIQ